MTTEQKLPEWWDEFCDAVKTRTLHRYECRANHRPSTEPWRDMQDMASTIYRDPFPWQFRKRARTVRIEIEDELVELVAPVLAGNVVPRDTIVWQFHSDWNGFSYLLSEDVLVFKSESDRDAMRNALLGVKP